MIATIDVDAPSKSRGSSRAPSWDVRDGRHGLVSYRVRLLGGRVVPVIPLAGIRAHSRTRGQDGLARNRMIAVTTMAWMLVELGLAALVLPAAALRALH